MLPIHRSLDVTPVHFVEQLKTVQFTPLHLYVWHCSVHGLLHVVLPQLCVDPTPLTTFVTVQFFCTQPVPQV